MVEYNIVKYCRLCKDRFVVKKQEAKKNYCDKCQKRLQESDSQTENENER